MNFVNGFGIIKFSSLTFQGGLANSQKKSKNKSIIKFCSIRYIAQLDLLKESITMENQEICNNIKRKESGKKN